MCVYASLRFLVHVCENHTELGNFYELPCVCMYVYRGLMCFYCNRALYNPEYYIYINYNDLFFNRLGDGAPLTPSRRQRRTRSMSRSPSPVTTAPVASEPDLETLQEAEEQAAAESAAEAELETVAEKEAAAEEEAKPQEEESNNIEQQEEEENDEETETATETVVPSEKDEEEEETTTKEESNEEPEPAAKQEEHSQDGDEPSSMDVDTADKVAHQSTNGDNEKMDVDEEAAPAVKTDQEQDQNAEQDKSSERRKRSHSHTRSLSSSRSPKRRSNDKRDSKAAAVAAEERTVSEDEPTIEENKVGLSWRK